MINEYDYQTRIAKGKAGEKEIVASLKKKGVDIYLSQNKEDMFLKIDGWMMLGDIRVAVQIKFRESGNDVLFEVIEDIDRKTAGRDMECKAEYYLIRNRRGMIQLFKIADFMSRAVAIRDYVIASLRDGKETTEWGGDIVHAKIRLDKASGQRKLIAYFNPEKLKSFGEWNL